MKHYKLLDKGEHKGGGVDPSVVDLGGRYNPPRSTPPYPQTKIPYTKPLKHSNKKSRLNESMNIFFKDFLIIKIIGIK